MWLLTVNGIQDSVRNSQKGRGESVYLQGTDHEISSAQWQMALPDVAHEKAVQFASSCGYYSSWETLLQSLK